MHMILRQKIMMIYGNAQTTNMHLFDSLRALLFPLFAGEDALPDLQPT
jgi:hypothetical protein